MAARRPISPIPRSAHRAFSLAALLLLAGAPAARAGVVGVVGADLKEIARGRTAWILAGTAALTAASLAVENPDAEERALGRGALDPPADLGNIYGNGAMLAAAAGGLAGAGFLERDPDWVRAGSEMVRSMGYAGVAVTALKLAVRRTRPNGGAYSFPSGHTAVAFAVAPVIARRFGLAAGIPAYALAASTAIGRMEDRKHFLSDVVFGAGIGTAIGLAIAAERHDSEEPAPDLAEDAKRADAAPGAPKPVVDLGMSAAGLALTARF